MKTVYTKDGIRKLLSELKVLNDEYIKKTEDHYNKLIGEQEVSYKEWLEEYEMIKTTVEAIPKEWFEQFIVSEGWFKKKYKLDRAKLGDALPDQVYVFPKPLGDTMREFSTLNAMDFDVLKLSGELIERETSRGTINLGWDKNFYKVNYKAVMKRKLSYNKLTKIINKLTKCLHSEMEQVILEEDDLKTMIEFGWNKGE